MLGDRGERESAVWDWSGPKFGHVLNVSRYRARNRPIEDKESHRWLRRAPNAPNRPCNWPRGVTVIGDRGKRYLRGFREAAPDPTLNLLFGAPAQDRKIAEGGCLFAYTNRLPVAGRIQFCGAAPVRANAKAASPSLNCASAPSLSSAHTHIRKAHAPRPDHLAAWSTCAKPPPVPPGEEPIHWRLPHHPCRSRSGEGARDHRLVSSTLAYRAIVLDPQEPGLRSGSQSDRNRRSPDEVGDHGNTGCYGVSCNSSAPATAKTRGPAEDPLLHRRGQTSSLTCKPNCRGAPNVKKKSPSRRDRSPWARLDHCPPRRMEKATARPRDRQDRSLMRARSRGLRKNLPPVTPSEDLCIDEPLWERARWRLNGTDWVRGKAGPPSPDPLTHSGERAQQLTPHCMRANP